MQNRLVWISAQSVIQEHRTAENLTSGTFLVAVTEEERVWRIIYKLFTVSAKIVHGGIVVNVLMNHWILKSVF